MDYATPRPGEVTTDLQLGEVRAGDRKRRAAMVAARRALEAQSQATRFSPDAMDQREADLDAAQRKRLSDSVANATEAVERMRALRVRLTNDRNDALDNARNLADQREVAQALAEAEACSRRLSEMPAAIDRANGAVKDAKDALARFDASAAVRAADRASGADARRADDEKRARARAAADALFAEMMAEPAPKPTTVRGKGR